MVVVLIVAITAALAAPTVNQQMFDRRVRENALQVAQLLRTGRMRSLARGSAVMVRYRSTGFTVLESIEGAASATLRGNANCAELPGLGCLANNWTDATLSRSVDNFAVTPNVALTLRDQSGTAQTQMDLCFTPLGRAFISFDGNPPQTPMVGAVTFDLQRDNGLGPIGLRRTVAVLPNGAARLGI